MFDLKHKCKILIYVSRLLFPKYPGYYFPFCMLMIYNQLQKRKACLKVITVPYDSIKAAVNESMSLPSYWDDVNNTIIVSNCSNKPNQFVEIVTKNKSIKRIAFVVESSIIEQNYGALSDTLNFNLQMQNLNIEPLKSEEIKIASELDLSLISSPYELSNNLIDDLIKSYFKTPKIVHENDVLAVEFKKYAPDFYYNTCKYTSLEYVYFKCSRLCFNVLHSKGYGLCVIGETSFKQSVNIQSLIPSVRYRKVEKNKDYINCLINRCPWGLECYADALEKCILPFITLHDLQSVKKLQPAFLIEGNRGSGKKELVSSLALKLGLHQYEVINCDFTGTAYAQTEAKICNTFFKAKLCAPCFLIINYFENFGKNNEGQYDPRIMEFFKSQLEELFAHNTFPLILICISHVKGMLPTELRQCFLNVIQVNVPDSQQRVAMIQWIMKSQNILLSNINFEEVASKTHGFVFEDLRALVYHAKSKNWNFQKALDLMQSKYSQSLGAPKIPNVQWSDVGGLSEIEQEIMNSINLPLKHSHLFQGTGLKRSGILLYGPPGTGKTLVAKAVANECKLCFLSVKGPELLNMYVGQSEKNIREVFERAREASPCIIFFDELDSLAPNRGVSGDSGGVMDRVVSQLLAEMDGLDQTATIFIIGATNRPDLIDPALLRPGRFDKLLYVGPCLDLDSKTSVLRALTRKFNLHEAVDLRQIVQMCPQNITGADFYALCSNAWLSAARHLFKKEDVHCMSHQDVVVTMADFQAALKDLKPSIKPEDLIYFNNLKEELSATNNNKKKRYVN